MSPLMLQHLMIVCRQQHVINLSVNAGGHCLTLSDAFDFSTNGIKL